MGLPRTFFRFEELPILVQLQIWNDVIYGRSPGWLNAKANISLRVRMQPYLNNQNRLSFVFAAARPNSAHLDALMNTSSEAQAMVLRRFPDSIRLGNGRVLRFRASSDRIVLDPATLFALFMYMTPRSIRGSRSRPQAINYGPTIRNRSMRGFGQIQRIGITPLNRVPNNAEGLGLLLDNLLTGVLQAGLVRSAVTMAVPRDEPTARTLFEQTLRDFQVTLNQADSEFMETAIRELLIDWTEFWDNGTNPGAITDRLTSTAIPPRFALFQNLPPELRSTILFMAAGLDPDAHRIVLRSTMTPSLSRGAGITTVRCDVRVFQPGYPLGTERDARIVSQINQESRQTFTQRYPNALRIGNVFRRIYFHPQRDHIFVDLDSLFALSQWVRGADAVWMAQHVSGFENVQRFVVPHPNPMALDGLVLNPSLGMLIGLMPAGAVQGENSGLPLINGRQAGVHAAILNINRALLALGDIMNDFAFSRVYAIEWLSLAIDAFFATT